MTDAQTALAQVREALAAGPTPGPWYVRTNRHPTTDGRSWGWLDAAPPGGPQRAIAGVRVEWEGGDTSAVNARYLAACSPANMTAILAHVEAQEAEIERLTAALQYEQHRADRQGTHGDGCADLGPAHYECAIRERDELRRQLAEAELDARRYRWIAGHCRSTSEHWGGRWSIVVEGPCPAKHDEEDAFDDAIDAAMDLTRPAEEA